MRLRRRTRWPMGAAVIVTAALGLAACGGGDGNDGVATLGGDADQTDDDSDGSSEKDAQQAALDWAECMREHGVDVPDPEFNDDGGVTVEGSSAGGEPADPEKMEAANKKCQHFLDDAVNNADRPDLDPEQQRELQEYTLAFAECMREQGIDFPDPVFSDDGGAQQELPRRTPEFDEAQKHCTDEVGEPPGPEGGGATSEEGDSD